MLIPQLSCSNRGSAPLRQLLIFEVYVGQVGAGVQLLAGHVLHYLNKGGNGERIIGMGLSAKECWLALYVQDGLYSVGLVFKHEASPSLLEGVHVGHLLLDQLKVLSRSDDP